MAARRPVSGVRCFAGDSRADRGRAARRPVHWPRPERPRRLPRARSRASARSSPRPPPRPASRTVGDLLLRFPHSHRDRTVVPVAELEPGDSGTVRGRGPRQHAAPVPPPRPLDHLGQSRRRLAAHSGRPGSTSPGSRRSSTPGARLLLTGSRDKRGFGCQRIRVAPAGVPRGSPRTTRPRPPPTGPAAGASSRSTRRPSS